MNHNKQKKAAVISDITGFAPLCHDGSAAGHFQIEGAVLSSSDSHFFQSYGISKLFS